MLEATCDRAQNVLLDQTCCRLNAARFQQFTALLDAPVESNPGLVRLLAVRPIGR